MEENKENNIQGNESILPANQFDSYNKILSNVTEFQNKTGNSSCASHDGNSNLKEINNLILPEHKNPESKDIPQSPPSKEDTFEMETQAGATTISPKNSTESPLKETTEVNHSALNTNNSKRSRTPTKDDNTLNQPPKRVKPNVLTITTDNKDPFAKFYEKSPTKYILIKCISLTLNQLKNIATDLSEVKKIPFLQISPCAAEDHGSPYNYCLIKFKNADLASKFYDISNGNLVCLNANGAPMYFTNNNWECVVCRTMNFPLRNYCFMCFNHKLDFPSLIDLVEEPTNDVAIYQLPTTSTELTISEAFHKIHEVSLIKPRVYLDPRTKQSTGLCVFHFTTKDASIKFFNAIKEIKILKIDDVSVSFSYAITDELSESCDHLDNQRLASPTDISELLIENNDGNTPENLELATIVAKYYKNSPTEFILLQLTSCVTNELTLDIKDTLKDQEASFKEVVRVFGIETGAPYDYYYVIFENCSNSKNWHQKNKGKLHLLEKSIELIMHYTDGDWECHECQKENFTLRTYCFGCYSHKNGDIPLARLVGTPTTVVAIHCLPTYWKESKIKELFQRVNGFESSNLVILQDPATKLSSGLCILRFSTKELAVKFFDNVIKYMTRTDKISISYATVGTCANSPKRRRNKITFGNKTASRNIFGADDDPLTQFYETSPTRHVIINFNSNVVDVEDLKDSFPAVINSNGILYDSYDMYERNDVGAPYDYCIVTFYTPEDALHWYTERKGILVLGEKKVKLLINFVNDNWICTKCANDNFPLRTYCYYCYAQKDGQPSPFNFVDIPTSKIGISKLNGNTTNKNISEALQKYVKLNGVTLNVISDPQTKLSTGLCLLDCKSNDRAIKLFYSLDRLFPFQIDQSQVNFSFVGFGDVYEGIINFDEPDPLLDYYEECPTRFILIKFDSFIKSHSRLIDSIPSMLKSAGTGFDSCYLCLANDSKSPYDYCVVIFKTVRNASKWFNLKGGGLVLRNEGVRFCMHYIKGDWSCKMCGVNNFTLRTLCYNCFSRVDDRESPIRLVNIPTCYIVIYKLDVISTKASISRTLMDCVDISGTTIFLIPDPITGQSTGICLIRCVNQYRAIELYSSILRLHSLNIDGINASFSFAVVSFDYETRYVTGCRSGEESNITALIQENLIRSDIGYDPYLPLFEKLPTRFILLKYTRTKASKAHLENFIVSQLNKWIIPSKDRFLDWLGHMNGAPYDLCMVSFRSLENAVLWYETNQGTLQYRAKGVKFFMYFSTANWECDNCNLINFTLRTYCHNCFSHRDGLSSPVRFVKHGTNSIAFYKLKVTTTERSIFCSFPKKLRKLRGITLTIIEDPITKQSSGLCVLDFLNPTRAKNFMKALKGLPDFRIDGVNVEYTYAMDF